MTTIHTIEDLIRVLDENPEWVEALRARLLTRELLELPQVLAGFIESTNRRFDALEQRMDKVESDIQGIRNDLGPIKAAHARNSAIEEAYLIAEQLGLQYRETLNLEQLARMVSVNETADLSSGDLHSFRRADLVIRAIGRDDKPCYIAVEISFTTNGRDTDRAIRNAGLLTRFTGDTAYAAVAGLRLDDRIASYVESGEVSFYELDASALEVE